MREHPVYVAIDPATTKSVGDQGTCPVCGYYGDELEMMGPIENGGTYIDEGFCGKCGQKFRNFYDYVASELEL